jgi:peptidoglycan/LPS O-acetylase OafA/YrhL
MNPQEEREESVRSMQIRPHRVSPTTAMLLLLAASLFPLWVASHQQHKFLNDDTYITLTYAKSLVNGRGFVFNHPPPTLGTTSPLLALMVAGLAMALPRYRPRRSKFCHLSANLDHLCEHRVVS